MISFIDKLYLPQYNQNDEFIGSFEIDSINEIYRILDNVPTQSIQNLIDVINDIIKDVEIEFKTPEVKCSHCHESVPSFPISMFTFFLRAFNS